MVPTGKPKTGFPSTQWTDIHRWRDASATERTDLLRRFYERYRRPLALYIVSRGYSSSEADDMLHDFVMDHIEGRLFISADPARGRFRSLLLTALKNFIISRRRSAGAESRQPKNGLESLDAVIAGGLRMRDLIADSDTPEQIYERSWLLALLTNVLNSLREEYTRKNQLNRFELFERRVVLPILAGTAQPSLRDLAEEAGIDPAEASNCIVTAKRAYQRHLQTEIRAYVSSDKEVSEEISDLFHFLEKLHPGRAS